jgi:hypothetical protein
MRRTIVVALALVLATAAAGPAAAQTPTPPACPGGRVPPFANGQYGACPSIALVRIDLVAGCNNITLTFALEAPMQLIAASIDPPAALITIWRYDAEAGRFRGWSPLPAAPNDYTDRSTTLEAAFICLSQPATLTQPTAGR